MSALVLTTASCGTSIAPDAGPPDAPDAPVVDAPVLPDGGPDTPDAYVPPRRERFGRGVDVFRTMRVVEAGLRVAESTGLRRWTRDDRPPERVGYDAERGRLDERWVAMLSAPAVSPVATDGWEGERFWPVEPCVERAELLEWGVLACVTGLVSLVDEVVVYDLLRGEELARTSLAGEGASGHRTIPLGPRAFGLVTLGWEDSWGGLQGVRVDGSGHATLAARSTADDMVTPVALVGWPVHHAIEATGEVRDLRDCLDVLPRDCAARTGEDLVPSEQERVVAAEDYPTEADVYLMLEDDAGQRLVRMAFPSGEITAEIPWGPPSTLPTWIAHDPYSSDVFVARCRDAACDGGWDLERVVLE